MRFSGFLLALFFLSVPAAVLLGQDVEIDVEAPTLVPVGSTFRVEYVVKHKRPDRFIPPDMGELQVIAGPTGSVGRLDMNINGQASTVDLYIFTYVIHADKAGTFTLPPATAVVDGKNYTSRPVPFEVVEERGRGGAQRPQGGGQGGQQQQTTPEIAQDD
ncbi:MAG: BatD family protein, partial [Alistipes sp.]|nr:BatD family protein [Alistipes sp.]